MADQYSVALDTIKANFQALIDYVKERDGNLEALGPMGPTLIELTQNYQGKRYPLALVSYITNQIGQVIDEPNLGLKLAAPIRKSHQPFEQLLKALDCSYVDYLKAFRRYIHLSTQVFNFNLELQPDGVILQLVANQEDTLSHHQVDAFVCIILAMIKERYGITAQTVQFEHAVPDNKAIYSQYLGLEPVFESSTNAITFARDPNEHTLEPGRITTTTINSLRQMELDYHQAFPSSWSSRSEFLLELLLFFGEPKKETLADIFALTPRTLQRRLEAENSSFRAAPKQVRMQAASKHLQLGPISNQQLAFVLGYSESSQMCKAFKQWFGTSLANYRNNLQNF